MLFIYEKAQNVNQSSFEIIITLLTRVSVYVYRLRNQYDSFDSRYICVFDAHVFF